MRNTVLILSAILIFAGLNVAIYHNDKIKHDGEIILLKLEPIDPRSFMQGDYMALHYAIEDDMNKIEAQQLIKHRFVVIAPDKNNVAKFIRLYQGEKLSNEKLIKYRYNPQQRPQLHLKPNSFFFQEDLKALYQKAEYAIFSYRGEKDYLLVGLADKQRNKISASFPSKSGSQVK